MVIDLMMESFPKHTGRVQDLLCFPEVDSIVGVVDGQGIFHDGL
jgi:hypothetical protein